MNPSPTPTSLPRHPFLAGLMSLLCPGLGHVYVGDLPQGLVLMFLTMVFGSAGWFALLPLPYDLHLLAVASGVLWMLVWIFAYRDARRRARDAGDAFVPRDYNRPLVYGILFMLQVPLAVSGAFWVRSTVVAPFRVATDSMAPSLSAGDFILADRRAYRLGPAVRGDLVVFPSPDDRSRIYIKRVIALPGDLVEVRGGRVILNGNPLKLEDDPENPGVVWEHNHGVRYPIRLDGDPDAIAPVSITVPHGSCLVLGDHRNGSHDSRKFGPLPLRDLEGRVTRTYFPRWRDVGPIPRS